MTEYSNHIYVDSTIESEKTTQAYLPTIFKVKDFEDGVFDISSVFTTMSSTINEADYVGTEATLSGVFIFEQQHIKTDITHNFLTSATPFKTITEFCTISSTLNSDFSAKTEFSTAIDHDFKDAVETTHYIGSKYGTFEDIINTFYIYIGDIDNKYDVIVDLYLSNEKYYSYKTDVFASIVDLVGLSCDVELKKGRTANFYADMFSTSIDTTSGTQLSIFSTISGIKGYECDVDIETGTMSYIIDECCSTAITNSSGISYDVRTWSLEFGDFFIEDGAFTAASSIAWIDIIDRFCLVDISNSYFMVGSGQVSTYFEPINNGYRMLYNPIDDYIHLGEFDLTAHAQNIYGDILENSYKFMYGGNIEFNDVVDFGPGNQVMVWAKAYNTKQCRQFSTSAYYFNTAEFSSVNLKASINPVGFVDLPITIYPQNTFFFYGGYYTVTISGIKDYSGNILPEYSYRFYIENPLA